MKGKIIGISNSKNAICLGIRINRDVVRNLKKVLVNLKLEFADEFTDTVDSEGNPTTTYNPKKYLDKRLFFESKKFKVYVIFGVKKVHVITTMNSKDKEKYFKEFQKYFDIAK